VAKHYRSSRVDFSRLKGVRDARKERNSSVGFGHDQRIEALEQALKECAEAALDRIEALEEAAGGMHQGLGRARWSRRACGPYPPSARRGVSRQHQGENSHRGCFERRWQGLLAALVTTGTKTSYTFMIVRWGVWCEFWGGVLGSRAGWRESEGKAVEYATFEEAEAEARRLTDSLDRHQAVNLHYRFTATRIQDDPLKPTSRRTPDAACR